MIRRIFSLDAFFCPCHHDIIIMRHLYPIIGGKDAIVITTSCQMDDGIRIFLDDTVHKRIMVDIHDPIAIQKEKTNHI
jgi:hypothetical protein